MRERRDVIRPVLLKVGVVFVFSLGGILYSIFRTKKTKPSISSSSKSQTCQDYGNQAKSGETELRNDGDHVLQKTPSSSKFPAVAPERDEESLPLKGSSDSFANNFSPRERPKEDKDVYLLPEFNDLVKELDLAAIKASFFPQKDAEMLLPSNSETNRSSEMGDHEEGEIMSLRNMVRTLKERERSLEIQLLEYYGLKEQEIAVMELQNRLKLNNMEVKLFNLKIESLHADKKRLEEQVADYERVVSDLEAAKVKIKLLKKKLRYDAEQNKEHIFSLQERVVNLEDQENKAYSFDCDVQLKLQKLEDLEARELRNSNQSLRRDNSALVQKLECLQNIITSVLEDDQTEVLREETQCLRKENEDLARELERLNTDRCTDIEELVYLRWINACLRYELRNYKPGAGKTIARDLSKSLSPKSEKKAKQLILEYAHKEGKGEKGISVPDIDCDHWSSSQASYLTDSGELDYSSIEISSPNKTSTSSKSKVFGKLVKLLRGNHIRRSSLDTAACIDDLAASSSVSLGCNSAVSPVTVFGDDRPNSRSRTSSRNSTRVSSDLQRSPFDHGSRSTKGEDSNGVERQRRKSADGSSCVYKLICPISEDSMYLHQEFQYHGGSETNRKSELVKYAEALKDSCMKSTIRRRSASVSSF